MTIYLHKIMWMWGTQYARKFEKFSSGHSTGQGQFSFQFQREMMPKNAQTTTQLHSSFTFHSHATHSSVLAWRIPGTGEPDGLPSMGSHRVWHDWNDLAAAAAAAHASKVMLKILQARLQQYVNRELPDVQAGFRKGREARSWSNCQHLLDHGKSKRVPEKHLFLLYWLCQSL